jgi:hypothetical protein
VDSTWRSLTRWEKGGGYSVAPTYFMDYPVLPSDVEEINRQLRETYGIDTESSQPMWRVSWAADQYEMRVDDVTANGVRLLFPELMKLPKYSWIKDMWILENLVLVPMQHDSELAGVKKSYECIWKFKDRFEKPVKPEFWACQFVIDLVLSVKTRNPMNVRKYYDPDVSSDPKEQLAINKKRIDDLVEQLFGDESDLMMRTVTGEAVIVPRNYEKSGE